MQPKAEPSQALLILSLLGDFGKVLFFFVTEIGGLLIDSVWRLFLYVFFSLFVWKKHGNSFKIESTWKKCSKYIFYWNFDWEFPVGDIFVFNFQQGFPTSKSVEVGTLIHIFNVFPVGTVDGSEIR